LTASSPATIGGAFGGIVGAQWDYAASNPLTTGAGV